MVGRGITLRRATAAVAPRHQHARHRTELRQVLGVVPFVELALLLRRDIHRDQEQRVGARRGERIARPDLLAFEADDHLGPRGHPFGPGRAVAAADREIGRAVQDPDIVEIVERGRDLLLLSADPALGIQKAGNAQPLRDVLGVVPIVKLVLGDIREIHRRDQDALCHRYPPSPFLARR